MNKRLYRSKEQRILGGVCGGIAEYFDVDVTLIRLVCIIAALVGGGGVLFYLIAWIIIPENPYQTEKKGDEGGKEDKNLVEDRKGNESHTREALGWFFIILGLLILLPKVFPFVSFKLLWPIMLIGIGIWILLKRD
jgi:phage shock protein C